MSKSRGILLIAIWFGPIPPWFPIWLKSAERNADIDWLLITDAPMTWTFPPNVHHRPMTLDELRTRIGEFAGFDVFASSPYKVCDWRPLFSCLLDLVPGTWDFWGHCDLDMIYGNLSKFVTDDLLRKYDRVFGVGHLSLYRNTVEANRFFSRTHPDLEWREIVADPEHRGFDEHMGVNKVWKLHDGKFYENELLVADIDPHVRALRLLGAPPRRNFLRQAFAIHDGAVFQYHVRHGEVRRREFLYIHFQKRQMNLEQTASVDRLWMCHDRFEPMKLGPVTVECVTSQSHAEPRITVGERLHVVKSGLRLARRRIWGDER